MTEWTFWGDRELVSVYGNIYLRTFTEDWFKIVSTLASYIKGKILLDLGCGEGHTTKQILDRLDKGYVCDLVEPNEKALNLARDFLKIENKIGDSFVADLRSLKPIKKYDSVFTSHTNYYWADNVEDYQNQLDKAISLVNDKGRLLILTLPEKSDHYNVMIHQVYPTFNYSKFIVNYYKNKGFRVKVVKFKMRMYVGDILSNKGTYELNNFFKFIHNTENLPSAEESSEFFKKIKEFQKEGYLNFKDELIIIKK
jgi:ubiquinone/menaquinone biosynthesis C-methylase UbiE